jgi:hypothetical protein
MNFSPALAGDLRKMTKENRVSIVVRACMRISQWNENRLSEDICLFMPGSFA